MSEASARTVLVADASAEDRQMLRQALCSAGLTVVEATTGPEAIAAAMRDSFGAVVTDLWMPDADGLAVIRTVRQHSPGAAILVVTGGGPGLSIASAAALAQVWGARKIYVKPFTMNELVGEITALLPPA